MAVLTKREPLLNVSTGPHARGTLTTRVVMLDVTISLLPAVAMGSIHFGLHALLVVLAAVAAAVLAESAFCVLSRKKNTAGDLSAVVTGLMLALCLPPSVPLYVPALGSVFAILVVKCCFGGLGKNVMNPALAARCFLLIAFGNAMTTYTLDGVSAATPLAAMAAGESVRLGEVFLGSTSGVIGCSAAALLSGALYLLIVGGITWEIPVSTIGSYLMFLALFSGHGLDPAYLALQLCTGGILMGAFFMATDPVTSPTTRGGQLVYGVVIGVLSGLFRVKGTTTDSVSYAIIMSNLVVPFIDMVMVPKPYAYRAPREKGIPRAAVVLAAIALVSGLALSAVYTVTKDSIAAQQLAASAASYREVCPDAAEFARDPALDAAVEAQAGEVYGGEYGKSYINEAIVGRDGAGEIAGYVVSVTSGDGFNAGLTLSVGIAPDGTLLGVSFTEMNETPGKGTLCGEPDFKDQLAGVNAERLTLVKSGARAPGEINAVSGATVTSKAVVNAVNAALGFFHTTIAA